MKLGSGRDQDGGLLFSLSSPCKGGNCAGWYVSDGSCVYSETPPEGSTVYASEPGAGGADRGQLACQCVGLGIQSACDALN